MRPDGDNKDTAVTGAAFDLPVSRDGYRWWYVDGLSDCGHYGVVVIAFIGSVFSPYYYRARARGAGDPYRYCALNVALYGPSSNRWAMTERSDSALTLTNDRYTLARSHLAWEDSGLTINVDERSAPFFRRLRGNIRVSTATLSTRSYALDDAGHHRWQPIAPGSEIDVRFEDPAIRWRGHGYVDTNSGTRPLERDFSGWEWSRTRRRDDTQLSYHVRPLGGSARTVSVIYAADGAVSETPLPTPTALERTGWGMDRIAHCPGAVSVAKTLEDTPFYARSMLDVTTDSGPLQAVHESLSLDRFRKLWVRTLLPFRMPRVAGR